MTRCQSAWMVLLMLVLGGFCRRAEAAYAGYFNGFTEANGGGFYGYACNTATPAEKAKVLFYVDRPADQGGTLVAFVEASFNYSSFANNLCLGNPNQGFRFELSEIKKRVTGRRWVYAGILGENQTVVPLGGGVEYDFSPQVVGVFNGYTSSNGGGLYGFACLLRFARPVTVELYADKGPTEGGTPIATTKTNFYYSDWARDQCRQNPVQGYRFEISELRKVLSGVHSLVVAAVDSSGNSVVLAQPSAKPGDFTYDFGGKIIGSFSGYTPSNGGAFVGFACEEGREETPVALELYLDGGPAEGRRPIATTTTGFYWTTPELSLCNGQTNVAYRFEMADLLRLRPTAEGELRSPLEGSHSLQVAALNASGKRTVFPETHRYTTPPNVNPRAYVGPHHGVTAFHFGGSPSTGLGWANVCPFQRISDGLTRIENMVKHSTFPLARLRVPLTDPYLGMCGDRPIWSGDIGKSDEFDWSNLDSLLNLYLRLNPQVRLILMVAIDKSQKWSAQHLSDSFECPDDPESLCPDYLSSAWKSAQERILAALVSHVAGKAEYREAVVGYQLMNGFNLDNSYPVAFTGGEALARFRDYLRLRYGTNRALQEAWGKNSLTFETAFPVTRPLTERRRALAPLFIPSTYRSYADTRDFEVESYAKVTANFASTIKRLTNGQAVVGVRSGDILNARFNASDIVPYKTMDFFSDPNLDFYEIWPMYLGARSVVDSADTAYAPLEGLRLQNKVFVLENDYRVAYDPQKDTPDWWDRTNGYTPDLEQTKLAHKHVMTNALVTGRSPYLWEMAWDVAQPYLMPLWPDYQTKFSEALQKDRSSVAEIAYVVDPEMFKYFADGTHPDHLDAPGALSYLVEYPMYTWDRAGAPYDMLFLSQVDSARPYKVYVFFHTIGLSPIQVEKIKRTISRNRAVGIFIYADGMVDGAGRASVTDLGRNIRALTGMAIFGAAVNRSSDLAPVSSYVQRATGMGVSGNGVGDLKQWEYPTQGRFYDANNQYPVKFNLYPSFVVVPGPQDQVIATYKNSPDVAVAERTSADGSTLIYSASPFLAPGLIRYALKKAGGFEYTNAEEPLSVNRSYLSLYTRSATTAGTWLRTPEGTPLVGEGNANLTSGATVQSAAGQTLLFRR